MNKLIYRERDRKREIEVDGNENMIDEGKKESEREWKDENVSGKLKLLKESEIQKGRVGPRWS